MSSTSRRAARSPSTTTVGTTEEHAAPAGTYARYAPEVKRTIRNESNANVRALLIGVPVDSGYQGMGWG
jgi:hypothetical protein